MTPNAPAMLAKAIELKKEQPYRSDVPLKQFRQTDWRSIQRTTEGGSEACSGLSSLTEVGRPPGSIPPPLSFLSPRL
jgi:hypothetical protein